MLGVCSGATAGGFLLTPREEAVLSEKYKVDRLEWQGWSTDLASADFWVLTLKSVDRNDRLLVPPSYFFFLRLQWKQHQQRQQQQQQTKQQQQQTKQQQQTGWIRTIEVYVEL
ncbi:hypothetical protein Taro_018560 [Colocasia esculenta]|uniref:Uncharacterized protein n=1 Tax=Colocasia esculenta TaxID=4460 RepID=A0A843UU47_COLES|nr:hypothetical protein [Colocasia esculenta]